MLKGLKYFEKKHFNKDLISGIVIALVSIPISMGYAQIAGLPPQYGLYGSVLPILLFAFFSTSPQYIFGVDAAPAAMVGGTLASLGIISETQDALTQVPVIAFFTGIWLLIFALMKFGKLTRFVSSPVMGGFISGICFSIILMQIPKLFGGQAGTGEGIELIKHIISEIQTDFNIIAILIAIVCIVIIQTAKMINSTFPASVIVMVLAALLEFLLGFCEKFNIKILPEVDKGLGILSMPNFNLNNSYIGIVSGFSIAIVIAAETLLAENSFAIKNDYKIDNNSELLAFSICNIAASFIGVCPVNGSVSRSSMNDQLKGKSQVTSIVSAVIMVLILLFGTGFISYLPVPVLTSIVICALWSGTEFSLAKKLIKSNKKEFMIFMCAFFGVLIFGTIYGVVIGTILSFLNVIIRESDPPRAFLGVIPERNHFYNLKTYAKAKPIKNVIIYRFKGNLFFANINEFREDIDNAIQGDTKYIIVDASGISSLDATGAETLNLLYNKLKSKGIQLFLTEHISKVNEEMRTFGIGHIIESGGVRKTISDALAAIGYNRPYPLCENYVTEHIDEDTELIQEFEWAFGSSASYYIDIYVEKILRQAKAIDPMGEHAKEKYAHLWDGISPISDHILLDFMERKIDALALKYDINKNTIQAVIDNHRESIIVSDVFINK